MAKWLWFSACAFGALFMAVVFCTTILPRLRAGGESPAQETSSAQQAITTARTPNISETNATTRETINLEAYVPFHVMDRQTLHQILAVHYTEQDKQLVPQEGREAFENAVFNKIQWAMTYDESAYKYSEIAVQQFWFGREVASKYSPSPDELKMARDSHWLTEQIGFADVPLHIFREKLRDAFPDLVSDTPDRWKASLDKTCIIAVLRTINKRATSLGSLYYSVTSYYVATSDPITDSTAFAVLKSVQTPLSNPKTDVSAIVHNQTDKVFRQ